MVLKRLTVGGIISAILLVVGSGLVAIDHPVHGLPWLAGGVGIGTMAIVSYWRGRR
jgi:hypothetical protein